MDNFQSCMSLNAQLRNKVLNLTYTFSRIAFIDIGLPGRDYKAATCTDFALSYIFSYLVYSKAIYYN